MRQFKLGVRLESLGLPLRQALAQSERLAVAGVQVDATGDLSPKNLSQTGRRAFSHLLRSHNLALAALNCPLRHGLDHAEGLEGRIEYVQRVMSLSFDLGPKLVLVEAGRLASEPGSPTSKLMDESLLTLGRYGDQVGAVVALETGLDAGDVLVKFLDRFDTGGLSVNFNPANLLLNGIDPEGTLRSLRDRVSYFQARDARPASASKAAQEVLVGHGHIDWMRMIETLEEIEYHGWVTVRQDSGENRAAGITAGVQLLERLMS
jgi:L-ribulose-5-phosphate 3-epimerase